ncbi:MAG: choice-of-anchor D domain-containing protein [Candidatus Cloacimonetes bacterium]|nr:choice-of-anchor D domain-containing protein [Candidatus Cloacimonadota bacterium]
MRTTIFLVLLLTFCGLAAEWTIVASYEIHNNSSGLAWDGTWLYCGVYGVNGGDIYRIDPATGAGSLQCTGPQGDSFGLTWDGANLWYTDHPTASAIPASAYQIDLNGNLLQEFSLPDHYMSGIAWDAGEFWVSTYYDPDGHIYRVDNQGSILQQFAAPDNQPWDLCLENGMLWMADYWGDTLYKIDPSDGTVIESHASETTDPSGVVFDGNFLWYTDNGGAGGTDWLYKVDLGGAGTPAIALGFDEWDFGNTVVGQPASVELPITNIGTADLVVNDIDGGLEAFYTDETLPFTITPGQTVNATIIFAPTSWGQHESTLTISSNDPVHPQETVELSGYGIMAVPTLITSPASLAYNDVRVGAWTSRALTLSNQGQQQLVIDQIDITPDQWSSEVELPLSLATRDTIEVRVWFHSTATGAFNGMLTLSSNDPGPPPLPIFLTVNVINMSDDLGTLYWEFQSNTEDEKIVALHRFIDLSGDGVAEILVADNEYGVYCLNGNSFGTADVLWEFHTDIAAIGIGSIYDERALTTISDISGDGLRDVVIGTAWGSRAIFALDGATGEMLWVFDTHMVGDGGWVYQVDADFDYTGDGTPDVLAACGDDGGNTGPCGVFCLDGVTGAQVWHDVAGVAVAAVRGVEDITGDGVADFFSGTSPDAGDALVKLHSGVNGVPQWSYDTGSPAAWALAPLADINGDDMPDVVFGTFSADLEALDHQGNVLWSQFSTAGIVTRLDVIEWGAEQYVLPTHIGRSYCQLTQAEDGAALWSASLSGNFLDLSPLGDINGDGMFDVIGGTLGNVAGVFSGTDGAVLWQMSFGNPVDQTLAAGDIDGNGSVEMLVGLRNGYLACFSGGPDGGGQEADITLQVSANDGGVTEGAEVNMTGQVFGQQYGGAVPASGELVLYDIVFDTYDLIVSLDGYETYEDEVSVNSNATLVIELVESLLPVTGLTATVNSDTVTFVWNEPSRERAFLGVSIYRDGELVEPLWEDGPPFVITGHPNGTFVYAVSAVYTTGESPIAEVEVIVDYTAAGGDNPVWETALLGNRPNPFNPRTMFAYSLATPALVELRLYNVRGQLVQVLPHGRREAGLHSIEWNGLLSNGNSAASGVYFARLYVDNTLVQSHKCLLLK